MPTKSIILCPNHMDCFANKAGQCTILTTSQFKSDCPFYKSEEIFLKGNISAGERLLRIDKGGGIINAMYGSFGVFEDMIAQYRERYNLLKADKALLNTD